MEVFPFRPQKPLAFALETVLELRKSTKKYECGLNILSVFKEPEVFMILHYASSDQEKTLRARHLADHALCIKSTRMEIIPPQQQTLPW